jgi:hypothetical protein
MNLSLENIVEVINGIKYEERWVPLKGYEGLYEISDMGRVKSLKRIDSLNRFKKTDHIMSGGLMRDYWCVTLCNDGKQKTPKIHRLVALHFVPNPDGKPEVNHKNGNKLDNRAFNLEWCTDQENTRHSYDNGLQIALSGRNHYKSKKVYCPTLNIEFDNIQLASDELGVCRSQIGLICNNKAAYYGGLHFRFVN